MTIINASPDRTIQIGYEGEDNVTKIAFRYDSEWLSYGEGIFRIRVRRHGEHTAYNAQLVMDDRENITLLMTVTDVELSVKGSGEMQVVYSGADFVKKSPIYSYNVSRAVDEAADPPAQDVYTQIIESLSDLQTDVSGITGKIGDLSALTTTAKTDLVSAINEVNEHGGGGSMRKDKKICVFGDSIGYGYNNDAHSFVDILSERNVFASVHKNCVSGSTTATLTARLRESATEVAEADIIYCEYEANDIIGLKVGILTTDALVSTVRNCTSLIRNTNPTCTIIWLPLTIQHLSKIAGADLSYYQSWVNAMYPVFAELGINLLPILDTLNANHASSDGRHPNEAGHSAIADLIMQMPLGISNYPTALMTEWTGGAY